MANRRRITRGAQAVRVGSDAESFDPGLQHQKYELREQDASDAVANIMHWCAVRGVSWSAVVGRAADHFRCEGGRFVTETKADKGRGIPNG